MKGARLAGRATSQGCRARAGSFGAGARTLGRTGLRVSPVGFGASRVRAGEPLHRRALADALRGGVNLIDTSPSYGHGRSEELIGIMLANMVQQGEIRREELVLVSKAGTLVGPVLEELQARTALQPELLRASENAAHCIHPDALLRSVEGSLDRLAVEHIDVLLLQNPDVFLSDAARRGVSLEQARSAFMSRLRAAFSTLEGLVSAGTISWYGLSCQGLALRPEDASFVSLAEVVALAREVGGEDHHFAVAELPMNLFELGAAVAPEPAATSSLRIAAATDVGVLTHRPLNALAGREASEQLVRLADLRVGAGGGADADAALATVRKLEAAWATGLGKRLQIEGGSDAVDLFRWGQELAPRWADTSLEQWHKLRHEVIADHLGRTSAALLGALEDEARAEFAQWWTAYGTAMHAAFEAIEVGLRGRRHDTAEAISSALDPLLPKPWRDLPLARKAVLTVLSAEVSCVLVGMRQPGYVHDVLALREHPVRLLSAGAGPVDFGAVQTAMAQVVLEAPSAGAAQAAD